MRDDLFETLRTPPPVSAPLPASEVRRRGDRLRRRRTALQVTGAALAVALLVGGAVGLADRIGTRGEAPPIEPPKQSQTRAPESPGTAPRIDDTFPLVQGWPEPVEGERTPPSRTGLPLESTQCGRLSALANGGDRITSRQSDGSASWGRELRTYATEAAALRAWEQLRDELASCTDWTDEGVYRFRAKLLEPGAGTFQYVEWMEAAHNEAISVVHRGKAVLLGQAANEASGEDNADELAATELAQLADPLAVMCAFTAAGCEEATPPRGDPATLLTARDLSEHVGEFIDGTWQQVPDRDDPTLDCQQRGLASLGPATISFREWTGPGSARAATAVLAYGTEEAAAESYPQVVAQLEGCTDRMAGARELYPAGPLQRRPAGEPPTAWRIYTGPAPEQCTGCDSGWIDVQGVRQSGVHLVVVSVGGIGDLQLVPTKADWMGSLLVTAAGRTMPGVG